MGRMVLVTGGGRGIGREIAETFVAKGDEVTVTGRRGAIVEVAHQIGARGMQLDLEDIASVAALADAFSEGLDVIVNNAGAFAIPAPQSGAPLEVFAEYWHRNLQVNLVGAALVVTTLEDRIRDGGAIVSIGSIGAEYAGNPYSVAKAGLAAWNVGVSEKLGPRGIRANVVAPGYIEQTDLFGGPLGEERRADLVAKTHLGRTGLPADVATLVSFLASPAARNITGQTLHVNAGAHTTR